MFLKAQKGKNQFWRYLVTLFIVLIASQLIGAIPLIMTIQQGGGMGVESINMNDILASSGLSKNMFLVLMLIPFLVGFIALIWTVRALHGRTFADTTTGSSQFRWLRFVKGFILWAGMSAILVAGNYLFFPESLEWNFQLAPFLILMIISFVLIPFQTGFEEILFRGYLLQGFWLLTRNRWFAVLLTGLGFALLHLANPEVEEFGFGISMAQYITFGLFFGIITVLDNGLELAWGAHAANNIFISMFVTHEASALQTDAMFRVTEINPTHDFIGLTIACLIFMGICWKWFGWTLEIAPTEIIAESEADDSVLDSNL